LDRNGTANHSAIAAMPNHKATSTMALRPRAFHNAPRNGAEKISAKASRAEAKIIGASFPLPREIGSGAGVRNAVRGGPRLANGGPAR